MFRCPEVGKMLEHLGNLKANWCSVRGTVGGDESLPEVRLYGSCK